MTSLFWRTTAALFSELEPPNLKNNEAAIPCESPEKMVPFYAPRISADAPKQTLRVPERIKTGGA